MDAAPAKIIGYFDGRKQNIIPLFQRPYSWGEKNWKTLWDDIILQHDFDDDDQSIHFMGAIVSMPAKSIPVGVSKHLIIDGQQRLTTISLLLAAIRDTTNDPILSGKIHDSYLINTYSDDVDLMKFTPTQVDVSNYKSIIIDRKPESGEHLMSKAYYYFRELLVKRQDDGVMINHSDFLNTIANRLQTVMINLDGDDDPYLIFESLNFKGSSLTQADLVRNYLLMKFRRSVAPGGEQEQVYNQHWLPMERRLGEKLSDFIRSYLMKEGENIYKQGIYTSLKKHISKISDEKIREEMRQMQRYSELYADIIYPNGVQDDESRDRLSNLLELDVGTSHPLILRLMDAKQSEAISDNDFVRCLELIEAFIVRRAICSVPTNSLNKMFLQWARKFPQEEHVKWLLNAMSGGLGGHRFPSDSEFEQAFVTEQQYGRPVTRYVLMKIEESFGHKEHVDLRTATIEHVMPQKITETWKLMLGDDWIEVHSAYLNTFGNLTLTGYNSELSNLGFQEKKEKLNKSHIELNREICRVDVWGAEQIKRRGIYLADIAKRLWCGPVVIDPANNIYSEADFDLE